MSKIDGGIQCTIDGPDVFHPKVLYPIPSNPSRLNSSFNLLELGYNDLKFLKTYYSNMNMKRRMININQRVQLDALKVVKDWNTCTVYSTCCKNWHHFLISQTMTNCVLQ